MVYVEQTAKGLWAVGVRSSKGEKKVANVFATEEEAWKYARALNDTILSALKKKFASRHLPC